MSQQLSPKVTIGTGFPPKNNVGAWAALIEVVEFDTKWAMIHFFFLSLTFGNLNFEIGIGPLDAEVRKWKSFPTFINGANLEFDDSGPTKYIPFNFKKNDRISGRFAGINQSFGHSIEIQLQLFS